MSWFDATGLTNLAKSALKEAQKTIDKALDIQEESSVSASSHPASTATVTAKGTSGVFFPSWNLTASDTADNISVSEEVSPEKAITESPSKATTHSIWGSFSGSFFDPSKSNDNSKLKDSSHKIPLYSSDDTIDETFSKSKLVVHSTSSVSEGVFSRLNSENDKEVTSGVQENMDVFNNSVSSVCEAIIENQPVPLRHSDGQINAMVNRLSLVSSESGKNSTESLEVLGTHSLKSTPDSDVAFSSNQSISNSSSFNLKLNSESVEVLSHSLLTPVSDEELTKLEDDNPVRSIRSCEQSAESAQILSRDLAFLAESKLKHFENVELALDDDEDTVSYNSVSESTAPTILDINEDLDNMQKTVDYPITKAPCRSNIPLASILMQPLKEADKKYTEQFKEGSECQLSKVSRPLSLSNNSINFAESYASSNDGSLSDKTLNADSEVATMDSSIDDTVLKKSKDLEPSVSSNVLGMLDDAIGEKLSDSSSFCNVTYSGDCASATRKDSSVLSFHSYETVERISHSELENISGQGEFHPREQTSPISSESRSDLVKIGSEETSGHTSGDENETTTSSDIEIIPSPNGDPGSIYCISRQSPARLQLPRAVKHLGGCSERSSANVVDLVLGKSLATKVRGHNRELSEGSNQSTTSDDSHGSENERLIKRLSEMAEILESREKKLIELSRVNIELIENNTELKVQVENLQSKDSCDISLITEEYTQRLSALEKKFQQAIREKDIMRKQIESLKQEAAARTLSCDLERAISERDEIIKDLREEGEKLSKQQLHHTNIIRKLRAMEKENEEVIKTLRDKIAEQNQELDKCKKTLTAKEFTECSQIEAVYKLNQANKKLETDLVETKGLLDDANHRLDTVKTSLEATRNELKESKENSQSVAKRKEVLASLENDKALVEAENERLTGQLEELRTKAMQDERKWMKREEHLRTELREATARAAEAESLAVENAGRGSPTDSTGGGALLAQLAALQQSALSRDRQHKSQLRRAESMCSELQIKLSKSTEVERLLKEECDMLRNRLQSAEQSFSAVNQQIEQQIEICSNHVSQIETFEREVKSLSSQLQTSIEESTVNIEELKSKISSMEHQLRIERASCEAEKRRNVILQEQLKELTAAAQPSFSQDSSFNPGPSSSVLLAGDVSPPHSISRDSLASEVFGSSIWPLDDGTRTPPLGNSSRTVASQSNAVLAPVIEHLQSTVKQREGELKMAAETARKYQTDKDALNSEVAKLTAELDNLQTLQHQYDALLQMYGEKEEQLQEIRLDLQDVKDMYKMQLDEILMLKKQVAQWSASRS